MKYLVTIRRFGESDEDEKKYGIEIYTQNVEDLDVEAVIKAVNKFEKKPNE